MSPRTDSVRSTVTAHFFKVGACNKVRLLSGQAASVFVLVPRHTAATGWLKIALRWLEPSRLGLVAPRDSCGPIASNVLTPTHVNHRSRPTADVVGAVKAVHGDVHHRTVLRQTDLRVLFHCHRKSTNLHLQLRIEAQDALLVVANLAFYRKRGSGENVQVAGSVTGLEVASVNAGAEGSGRHALRPQDRLSWNLSPSPPAGRPDHSCRCHRA